MPASQLQSLVDQICPVNAGHRAMESKMAQYRDVDDAQNINSKYTHMYTIDKSVTAGHSISQTYGYVARVSLEHIRAKRTEFWDTRVECSPRVWKALRFACESHDIEAIVETLKAAGVKLLGKSLQMSCDQKGYKYDLPVFMINDPTSIEIPQPVDAGESKSIKVVLRAQKEYTLTVNTRHRCAVLLDVMKDHENLEGKRVQLFYFGKEMKGNDLIGQHLKDDGTIQAFIRKQSSLNNL